MQTQILSTDWSEEDGAWIARTNRGDTIKARFVIHSNGPLNRPKLPGISGIDKYTGHTFHTSRWDYDYTGGGPFGGLDKLADKRVAVIWNRYPGASCDIESLVYFPLLEETGFVPKQRYTNATETLEYCRRYSCSIADKRVAVIGTGATAVQCVPHLAAGAKELFVFQRTPSSIDVRNNTDIDEDWVKAQQPGWHHKRRTNFESLLAGMPVKEDLVRDGWTEAFRDIFGGMRQYRPSGWRLLAWSLGWALSSARKERGLKQYLTDKATVEMGLQEKMEMADFAKMEKVRARADSVVENADTAESLKPYYRQFCKRPCFHDEYLQAFNNPNVTLVDTDGQGVEAFTETGIVANGQEFEVDCIVFATGFEVGTDYSRRAGYSITGIDGLTISDKWADGMATFHGLHSRGFPNAFFFGPQQSGFTATYTFALDENAMQTAYILGELKKRGATRVDASEKAEAAWINTIKRVARQTEEFQKSCTPGYYNNEGHVEFESQNTFYGGGPIEFFNLMAKWREAGDLKGLEIS